MSAWGKGGSMKSCDNLLSRVERNDPKLVELVILPMKNLTVNDVNRLCGAIANGKNTNLKSISASGHHLPPQSLQTLGDAISKSRITTLAIGDKNMGDDGVIALCDGLKQFCPLQELDLCWKNISVGGMAALGGTFASSTNIRRLNLSRNEKMNDDAMHAFSGASMNTASTLMFPCLEYLDLSESSFGPVGVQSLVNCFLKGTIGEDRYKKRTMNEINVSRPQKLDLVLSSNSIGQEGCQSISHLLYSPSSISDSTEESTSLVSSLSLSKCDIGDDGLELLLSEAKMGGGCCNGLKKLDLSNNGIGSRGAKNLGEALLPENGHLKNVLELCMSGNPLGSEGVTNLTCGLAQSSSEGSPGGSPGGGDTCTVDSAKEKIGKEGISSALNSLDISQTDCGQDGAISSLRCTNLSSLRLFNNKLGSEGFVAITPHLRGGHPSLVHLDLGGNNAKEEAVAGLLRALLHKDEDDCSALRVLEIGGNEVGKEVEEVLQELAKVRPELDIARDKPKNQQDMEKEMQSFMKSR